MNSSKRILNSKVIFLFILIIGFSLIFQACGSISATENSNEINITVENKPIRKIPSDVNFIGVNWMNDGIINREIFTNPENMDEFGKVLNNLKLDSIRYPNGNQVLTAFWDISDSQIVEALNKISYEDLRPLFSKKYKAEDRLSFPKFMEFCRKYNIKSTIQVNDHSIFDKKNNEIIMLKTYTGRPKNKKEVWKTGKINWILVNKAAKTAAAQVKWVKDNNYSDLVKFWEIGNEEYGKLGLSAAYSGTEYGKVASVFIKEMKKVDPSIRIIITNNFKYPLEKTSPRYKWNDLANQWSEDIMKTTELRSLKNDVFAVSAHIGPVERVQYGRKSLNINNEFFKSFDEESKGRFEYQYNSLKNLGYGNSNIFVNEFNEYAGVKNLTNHNWIGALLNARTIMNIAPLPYCYHMDYHILFQHLSFDTEQYNNYGSGIVHFAQDFKTPFVLQPTAYVLKFFNENLKGTVLNSSVNNDFVAVLPVIENNKLKLIILNIEKNKTVNLNLKNFSPLEYKGNSSLGIGIPEKFTIIDIGDSYDNPSEVRQINLLKDKIAIKKKANNEYSINLPQTTLSVFDFNFTEK